MWLKDKIFPLRVCRHAASLKYKKWDLLMTKIIQRFSNQFLSDRCNIDWSNFQKSYQLSEWFQWRHKCWDIVWARTYHFCPWSNQVKPVKSHSLIESINFLSSTLNCSFFKDHYGYRYRYCCCFYFISNHNRSIFIFIPKFSFLLILLKNWYHYSYSYCYFFIVSHLGSKFQFWFFYFNLHKVAIITLPLFIDTIWLKLKALLCLINKDITIWKHSMIPFYNIFCQELKWMENCKCLVNSIIFSV